MKVRVPGPGQLHELENLWFAMSGAHDQILGALRDGAVPREHFMSLWKAYSTAREKYESLAASFPEIEMPD